MLGGKYHITAHLFCSNIWRLIIVTVSQDTVWEQGEFGRDAPTRCAKHVAQSWLCGHPLLGGLSFRGFLLSSAKLFTPFLYATRQLILEGGGSLLCHFPGKRTLCIGAWSSLPRSVQRVSVGGKLGLPSCTGKATNFSLLSCFTTPQPPLGSSPLLLYMMALGLPRKPCISTTPHCSALVTPSLALLQDLSENTDCWKPQGLSGDSAVLRAFLHLYL